MLRRELAQLGVVSSEFSTREPVTLVPQSSLLSRSPFQYNYNTGFLNGTASQSFVNIQPVFPFAIGENWNLISRTILPVVSQTGFRPGGVQNGLGNTT